MTKYVCMLVHATYKHNNIETWGHGNVLSPSSQCWMLYRNERLTGDILRLTDFPILKGASCLKHLQEAPAKRIYFWRSLEGTIFPSEEPGGSLQKRQTSTSPPSM